ncbi:hypothetical protein [Synechococcus sp. BA-132 BA5]|uniref:hypothetical protein n=1 Tax=Synechococcus sp. BA-132 BA5 TaxID=3110252 RepID=UPI002B213045|nr:hypothetical protein [Synechococcus sp. BA-132 BA5]MEA5417379.1 hypothetical protein [Synechococcus sp. BA-132 BA5]
MLRHSRKGSTSWPPQALFALWVLLTGSWPALARRRRLWVGSSAAAAMAQVQVQVQVQVLHDVLQSGIRWRVTLHACPDQGLLVRFEKSGKGGRLLHQQLARWSPLYGAGFILPRDQVAGGLVPKYLVERIEAVLRGSPLPARRSEREQVRGRLVRAR